MADLSLLNSNIIAELGIAELPEEKKLALFNMMAELLQKRILFRVLKALPPEKQTELDALGADYPAIIQYMVSNVPNFESIVNEESAAVKEEMIKAKEEVLTQ